MASAALTAEIPVIQVLDKAQYFTQAIVPLPSATLGNAPSLAPSSVRVRSKVISLTSNNFTYARLGFLFHWWDAHPLPEALPPPYADPARFGRLSAWGWAEVLESTHPAVPSGSFVWGYQPIGTLAQDLVVRTCDAPGQVIVTNEYRQQLMPIYNRYFVATGGAAETLRREIADHAAGPAYDAVVRVMFETAYLMARYCLGGPSFPPSALPFPVPWTPERANVHGAAVVVLAPGSKVGLCLARELRSVRSQAERPAWVIGAASKHSKSFVEGTGLYDAVVEAEAESPVEVLSKIGVAKETKTVLIDLGGRGNAGGRWAAALQPVYGNFLMLAVGSEISEVGAADVLAGMQASAGTAALVNMSDLREGAMKLEGEAEYYEKLQDAWDELRDAGLGSLKMRWGEGMEAVSKGWDELARGEVKPEEGLAFAL